MEVAGPIKMVADAVGMLAVLRSSGGKFKLPNVFCVLKVATAMFRAGSTDCGCVVAALDNDQVKHDAPSLIVGALRKNAAGAASFEGNFLSCAFAAAEAAFLVLQQVGELVWLLDAIISMNLTGITAYQLLTLVSVNF